MPSCCNALRLFCKDFKAFALQGRVIDLAVGWVIGRAFSDVIKSSVNDIILPPFGFLIGGVAFSNLTIKMHNFAYPNNPPVVIRYGEFIQTIIYLILVSFSLFCIIILVTRLRESKPSKEKQDEYDRLRESSEELKVLMEIRDLLGTKKDPQT